MTTPSAPGVPEGEPDAPGAQDPAPQIDPNPDTRPIGKPNQGDSQPGKPQAPGAPPDKPDDKPEDEPQDVKSLPDWAQKLIKKARADAGSARTAAKQAAADEAQNDVLAKISKALGLNTDEAPTVDSLTEQLNERQARIEELEAKDSEHTYARLVNAAAKPVNADADALLDSGSFRAAVLDELDDEFTDDQLSKAIAKVAKEFAKKPRFALTTSPPRSGGEIPGGPPAPGRQRPRSLNAAVDGAYRGG